MNGKQLKNSILQWAIQGKLVPQDPNDEPASVLLEKIRAEKARLIKEGKIKKDKKESIIYRGEDNSYYEKFADGKVVCIDEEIPFEIPLTWAWVRLNFISIIARGSSPRPIKDYLTDSLDGINWIKIGDTEKDGMYINSTKEKITVEGLSKSRLVHKGDFLLTNSMSFGRPYITNVNGCIHDGWLVISPIGTSFKQKFLYYLLSSGYAFSQFAGKVSGAVVKNLNSDKVAGAMFPLPPYNEQQRILDKLDVLVPKINTYGIMSDAIYDMNTSLRSKLRKSILQEAILGKLVPQDPNDEPASVLFQRIKEEKQRLVKEEKLKKKDVVDSVIYKGDDNKYYEQIGKEVVDITENIPFKIPDSWVWCRMGAIGIWGAGSTPSKGNPNYYGGNILWLRTGELNNSVVYDTEIKITQKALEECSLRMNKVGDILIAMYGATIGKVAIVGKEMTTNQACCACTPIGVFNWYLFYFLMASQQYFIKIGEGGAQPNISREKLISYLIPIPPIAEQMRIVEKLKTILNKIKD